MSLPLSFCTIIVYNMNDEVVVDVFFFVSVMTVLKQTVLTDHTLERKRKSALLFQSPVGLSI